MEVRPVDHRDPAVATDIVRIQRQAYAVEAELIRFAAIPNLTESVHDIQRLDLVFAAALSDAEMVGFVGHRREGAVVRIDRLAVDPAAFRRGTGTALLRFVEAEYGAADYVVSTGAGNTPAIRLYESVGFRRTTEQEVVPGLSVVHLLRHTGQAGIRPHLRK